MAIQTCSYLTTVGSRVPFTVHSFCLILLTKILLEPFNQVFVYYYGLELLPIVLSLLVLAGARRVMISSKKY
jgi:hypothetical protein